MHKHLCHIAIAGMIASYALWSPSVTAHTDLRLVNWGGDLARAHMQALVIPWEENTGKNIDMVYYGGGLNEIREQVDTTNVRWDVVDMEYSDLIQACSEGLLEPIDHASLLGDTDDFLADALPECGVGTYVWATVYAYDPNRFKDNPPKTLKDFFNMRDFPGHRGLRKDPRGTLEWALMAAGVPADQVYSTLATPQGETLAFKELDKIKSQIVWWTGGQEPVELLRNGTVAMTAAWNGRLYRPMVEANQPITIVWDGQLWELEFLGVLKGTKQRDNAFDFIKFATSTEALANVARYIPYGPVRQSSQPLISTEVKAHLPTEHMGNALRFNSPWWATNIERIRERFEQWAEPALDEIQQRGARF